MGGSRWLVRTMLVGFVLAVMLVGWAVIARRVAPTANTSSDHFDAILVLGTPADADGNPTPEQLARVTEAVREYERGIAPRLLFTGGPAHNHYVEADVMASSAAAQGIPPSAIFVETKATDTIQNACYSARIMQTHGWHSAEIVSSDYHLARAALIFSHTSLDWRMHAAPPMQPGETQSNSIAEILKTMRYLLYANWAERCEP
ncbi:YdcF family protein [Telmatobacter sp. DSM 110680]|uniref:YdcF family protein n=1 Tax=Telmatobacter sp. DSM 110680 TaxID=3036704 RepID=A0AAU7DLU6_9BACT